MHCETGFRFDPSSERVSLVLLESVIIIIMSTFVRCNLNSPQMHHCYIIELV